MRAPYAAKAGGIGSASGRRILRERKIAGFFYSYIGLNEMRGKVCQILMPKYHKYVMLF